MRVSAINLTRSPTLRALPTMETSYRFAFSPSSTRRRMTSERPGQLQIAVLITSLSETYCGRWIVACYRAHPVAGRCCNLCPKSKGRTELLARPQRIACHFPFAFSPRCENELRTAEYSVRQSLPFWRHFPFAFHLAFYGGYGGLDSFRGCVSRQMILSCPSVVFMKCKADKSEHHQDGSSYHQPMRILHRGAS